jgi:hypothetical protein
MLNLYLLFLGEKIKALWIFSSTLVDRFDQIEREIHIALGAKGTFRISK